jgi:hypothetical protein
MAPTFLAETLKKAFQLVKKMKQTLVEDMRSMKRRKKP